MLISILLWTLALLLVAVGVAGTVIPGLPGTVLVLAGLVLAAWMDGFSRVGAGSVAVLVGLTLLAYAADLSPEPSGPSDRAPALGRPSGPGWVRWWACSSALPGCWSAPWGPCWVS